MASRRMFAIAIIDSDIFLDMPLSSQSLYYHLSMRADDDGFVNNPKKICRMIGAAEDDLTLLIAKSFIITFDSGVVLIKHWKIHNYIQKDRYKPTIYIEEKSHITEDVNKTYTERIHHVSIMEPQVSKGEDSEGENIESGSGSSCSNDQLMRFKGNVFLSENQIADLLDKLEIDTFNYYINKLDDFIIEKGAKIKNHYSTIIKWYTEDSSI